MPITKDDHVNRLLKTVSINADNLMKAIKNGNIADIEDLMYVVKSDLICLIYVYENSIDC